LRQQAALAGNSPVETEIAALSPFQVCYISEQFYAPMAEILACYELSSRGAARRHRPSEKPPFFVMRRFLPDARRAWPTVGLSVTSSPRSDGGGADNSELSNYLILNNSAPSGGGAYNCIMLNCTISFN